MSEEIKIVITLKENRGAIGVQSPNCDPVFTTFEGGLGIALEKVPGLVVEANQRWDSSPRYPKSEIKLESQPAQITPRRETPHQGVAQQAMF